MKTGLPQGQRSRPGKITELLSLHFLQKPVTGLPSVFNLIQYSRRCREGHSVCPCPGKLVKDGKVVAPSAITLGDTEL
jgi:hypothetical protein